MQLKEHRGVGREDAAEVEVAEIKARDKLTARDTPDPNPRVGGIAS